jgi:hypothetical protein
MFIFGLPVVLMALGLVLAWRGEEEEAANAEFCFGGIHQYAFRRGLSCVF